MHANLVNDVRLQTLEDGGPVDSGILEVTTGPSGTDTFKADLNDEVGNPQAGDLVNTAFFTRPPPDGPGIRCSKIDVFSYGQVTVTGERLTIALRDAQGRHRQGCGRQELRPLRRQPPISRIADPACIGPPRVVESAEARRAWRECEIPRSGTRGDAPPGS